MKELIFYLPKRIKKQDLSKFEDVERFLGLYKIFSISPGFIDRTSTIKMPIDTKLLFPIPEFRKFDKSFEEICNDRARDLLEVSKNRNCKIYLFYSGGIDSTLMLVSFLKNINEEDKKRLIILLSEESIKENPNFYNGYIKGKLAVQSSNFYTHLFNNEDIFLLAENNDQLFGADIVGDLINKYGEKIIHEPYNREIFIEFFDERIQDKKITLFFLDLFEKQNKVAPIPITTNFLFLWWINFSFKWQGVTLRAVSRIKEIQLNKIEKGMDYLKDNYLCFYNTEDFQLWSLNNPDKRIKDTWNSYKYICKDIIYDFNKDAEYRDNKLKIGSLGKIMRSQMDYRFIDEDFLFYRDQNIKDYYLEDNDFK